VIAILGETDPCMKGAAVGGVVIVGGLGAFVAGGGVGGGVGGAVGGVVGGTVGGDDGAGVDGGVGGRVGDGEPILR
jgi:hypothetical protein